MALSPLPDDCIHVVIEIPRGSRNKYEIDHDTGHIFLDRRLFTPDALEFYDDVNFLKAGLVAAVFMHLAAEKRLIYRVLIFTGFFVLGLFWLTFLAWYNPVVR